MTDNEIIKALECCTAQDFQDCNKCPLNIPNEPCRITKLPTIALDLINRQKAVIEKSIAVIFKQEDTMQLIAKEKQQYYDEFQKDRKEIDDFARSLCEKRMLKGKAIADFEDLQEYIKDCELKAIKEFAERLKKTKETTAISCSTFERIVPTYRIDNLVKEMTEEIDFKE